jgi:Zn-dependent protease with chaperone function
MGSSTQSPRAARSALGLALVLAVSGGLVAQTKIERPKNKYTVQQDVQLGKQAAAEARKKLPIIEDAAIDRYLDRIGDRLVDASPEHLVDPAFEFSFTPVNEKDINAFALPGGPMFVNRGMVEAAGREDEVTGVMAHELAHVLLRHGTANMTKAQSPGITVGAIAGAIAGAVVGGTAGALITDVSQFGLGAAMMKYSRDYERQADLLGVQIMARAGYDPTALAAMFERIQKEGGGGGPQWLSSHPNPGNRTQYILAEAKQVQVAPRPSDAGDFKQVQSTMASLPKTAGARGGPEVAEAARERLGRFGQPVPPPSPEYRTLRAGQFLQLSAPSNWNALSSNNTLKLVPPNAYGEVDGQTVFTHGIEIGLVRNDTRDLRQATASLIDALAAANPDLRARGDQQPVVLSNRSGLSTPLVSRSATGQRETIGLYTTLLRDGQLFYFLTTVPEGDVETYVPVFRRVGQSLRLNDVR